MVVYLVVVGLDWGLFGVFEFVECFGEFIYCGG